VDTVDDVAAMLTGLQPPVPSGRAPAAEPVPGHLSGEPHRALVDMVLAATQEHTDWLRDGGTLPDLPRYWSTLWRAAVQRQMALTDEPEPVASATVRSIVDQLAALHRDAAWFREYQPLRERAIAETLLCGTGLSDTVLSHAAQLAWQRLRDSTEQLPAVHLAAHRDWLAAWSTWTGAVT
jgi:hypothetical protein